MKAERTITRTLYLSALLAVGMGLRPDNLLMAQPAAANAAGNANAARSANAAGTTMATEAATMPAIPADDALMSSIGWRPNLHFPHYVHPVKIAIVDDAFDLDNPLWAAHIAHNEKDIPGNNIDEDHNGKTDDYEGWDFGDNDNDVRPARAVVSKESHGTHVLGVLWSVLQRLSGSAEDMQHFSILPIKAVCDLKMNNYLMEGYKGIDYAISQHADIIVCSWSGPFMSAEEKGIVQKAHEKGIIIIGAAGNFYAMQPEYPAAEPSVISVAAVDREGRKHKFSNYGMFVDICAPGDSLLTYDPYKANPTAHLSATSAATPVVAAVIAAIRAAYPAMSGDGIARLLANTARPLDELNPLYAGDLGAGMVDVGNLLEALTGNADFHCLRQARAYVNLQKLNVSRPVRIAPSGKYQQIRLILQSEGTPAVSLPDVLARYYRDGHSKDTLIRRDRLKYPLLLSADSIDLTRGSDRQQIIAPGKAWLYYEAVTIDSSVMYCGGGTTEITGTEGYIEDGSGDQRYTGRNDCKWQITVPAGKRMRISFEQFDTEPKIDQVYIFSGNSTKDPILAIFSGHKIPPVINSWGNTVLVWFLTSEENNFQGWKLHYKAIDPQ